MLAMADEHLRNIAEAEQVLEYDLKQAFKHEREQGTERGIAIGELNAKLEMAREMLMIGLPVQQIMQITKLTEAEINQLTKE